MMVRAVGATIRARSPWVMLMKPMRSSACIASRTAGRPTPILAHQVALGRQMIARRQLALGDPREQAVQDLMRQLAPPDRFAFDHAVVLARLLGYDHKTGRRACKRVRRGWKLERASELVDRAVPPADTVARVRPHLQRMGITRLADLTGLDRIGVPVFAAVRPNSRSVATSQGKGLTRRRRACCGPDGGGGELACRAAVERRCGWRRLASCSGRRLVDLARLPHRAGTRFDPDRPILWIEGADLVTGEPVLAALRAGPHRLPAAAAARRRLLPGLHAMASRAGNTPRGGACAMRCAS